MRLVIISDTHGLHRQVQVPDGDVLIHAGDLGDRSRNKADILDVAAWLRDLPHPHKLLIPGNHDYWL